MYNILNLTTMEFMLGMDVDTWFSAQYYVEYYRNKYGAGVPYYNGKGIHDGCFVIIRFCEETGLYRVVQ